MCLRWARLVATAPPQRRSCWTVLCWACDSDAFMVGIPCPDRGISESTVTSASLSTFTSPPFTLRWSAAEGQLSSPASPLEITRRKPETVPLEGELGEIIERRRDAKAWQGKDGQGHFSEYVFHDQGQPIGDFRKAWATACCAAGVGKFVCPTCSADVNEKRECEALAGVLGNGCGAKSHSPERTRA